MPETDSHFDNNGLLTFTDDFFPPRAPRCLRTSRIRSPSPPWRPEDEHETDSEPEDEPDDQPEETLRTLTVETVILNLDEVHGLGISIEGDALARNSGIYVNAVISGGAAALDGRIESGDMIMKVNEVAFSGFTHREAADVIRHEVGRRGMMTLTIAKQARIDQPVTSGDNNSGISRHSGPISVFDAAPPQIPESPVISRASTPGPLGSLVLWEDPSGIIDDDNLLPPTFLGLPRSLSWDALPYHTNSTAVALPRGILVQRDGLSDAEIHELKQTDLDSPAPPMSRACKVCFAESPNRRAVFTECGHSVCRPCAEKLKSNASVATKKLACPFCRTETGFILLFEDPLEEAAK